MEQLQQTISPAESRDIHAIAGHIERHVNENWDTIFQNNHSKLLDLYNKIGDPVYGMYGKLLFAAIHQQLEQLGLQATPKLPGNLMISREWGPDDDRQRWMWSKIATTTGEPVGTIVVVVFHDHYQLRVPRPFGVLALKETGKRDVVAALSRMSSEFASATEMKDEVWEGE